MPKTEQAVDLIKGKARGGAQLSEGTDPAENRSLQGIIERLKAAIDASGLKAPEVAEKAGIPLKTLANYMRGGGMKVLGAVRLAQACGVSVEWLLTGVGPGPGAVGSATSEPWLPPGNQPKNEQDFPDLIRLPRYDVRAAAGDGAEVVSEHVAEFIAFSESWIKQTLRRKPDGLAIIEAVGNSMSPTINDGDTLIIDTKVVEANSDGIYVLSVRNSLMVKRIQLQIDGDILVLSDNPSFEPKRIQANDFEMMRIVGQVLWAGGSLGR